MIHLKQADQDRQDKKIKSGYPGSSIKQRDATLIL